MLSYKTETRPDLVALYDNRPGPGNGAGQFLQPWSPHGARISAWVTSRQGLLSLPSPGSVNEYQLRLGRQMRV